MNKRSNKGNLEVAAEDILLIFVKEGLDTRILLDPKIYSTISSSEPIYHVAI